jgi:hypothetical protein
MNFAKCFIALLVCFGEMFFLTGCGGKSALQQLGVGPMVAVEGKVTLGGKPLMGGNVFFYPQGEVKNYTPSGVIDTQGNYFLATSGEDGVPVGKYRVTVEPASEDKSQDMLIDVKYTSFEKSPLIIEVKENAPAGTFDLKLPLVKKH